MDEDIHLRFARNPTEETRLKMRQAQADRDPLINARIASTLTGRRASDETKAKMSAAHKQEWVSRPRKMTKPRKPMSEQARRNMSEAALRRGPISEETRRRISEGTKAGNARKRALPTTEECIP